MRKTLLFAVLFPLVCSLICACQAADLVYQGSVGSTSPASDHTVRLLVDKHKGARAFYDGVLVVPSIGGHFEIFKRDLRGHRRRILSGPWRGTCRGHLKKISNRVYVVSGNDPSSGAGYKIAYKQLDSRTVKIHFSFRPPGQLCSLSFELLKLSGGLFKGARVEAEPHNPTEPDRLPLVPRPMKKRFLLKNKQKLLVSSSVCDLRIACIGHKGQINVADFRNVYWDRKRSFYFYVNKIILLPKREYSFEYIVSFAPPSEPTPKIQEAKKPTLPVTDPFSFFKTQPKKQYVRQGAYYLGTHQIVYAKQGEIAAEVLAHELRRRFGIEASVKALPLHLPKSGIVLSTLSGENKEGYLPAEGFEIDVTRDRVMVTGRDARGLLYGVYALLSMVGQRNRGLEVQCGIIRDWPDLPKRGMCIEMLPPAVRDTNIFKRYLYALSMARCNLVIFYHNPRRTLAWKEGMDDGGWTKAQMREIASYARSLHMDVWAGMVSKFSKNCPPQLRSLKGSNFYDPFKKGSLQALLSLYGQIIDVYRPSVFLIGHDEVKGLLRYAAKYNTTPEEIFGEGIRRLYSALRDKGIQTAMWGDMLLDWKKWAGLGGAAHGGDPGFASGPTHMALKSIPKEITILDWHYQKAQSYPSIKYFKDKGFKVLGVTWYDPRAAKSMAQSVKHYGGDGILGTDWGFWRTLSPSATTLYALKFGWDLSCNVDDSADIYALAEVLRGEKVKWSTYRFVGLDNVFNETTIDLEPGDGRGLFDVGPVVDLRNMPVGEVQLAGIPFYLREHGQGGSNNCIVVGSFDGRRGPIKNRVSIHLGGHLLNALAFLHTCYVKEPQYSPVGLGNYKIVYTDGTMEKIELKEGWNITDIRSSPGLRHNDWSFARCPDVLIGSRLAWRGQSLTGLPLNLQVLIWKNPYPKRKIKEIIVQARGPDEYTKIALLAVTALN